ncbi:hypothetical protein BpHYR1_030661 [Brachionus plicatilis]|uniref:Uncharacterized protein n=1 Tax=Brachionus plicatilis TaxID=10195 RepID=A0A3M7QDP3_BRAPC|nr:hypothetical protein BpHYR1_030661 [Brachionus plicatilis]
MVVEKAYVAEATVVDIHSINPIRTYKNKQISYLTMKKLVGNIDTPVFYKNILLYKQSRIEESC